MIDDVDMMDYRCDTSIIVLIGWIRECGIIMYVCMYVMGGGGEEVDAISTAIILCDIMMKEDDVKKM